MAGALTIGQLARTTGVPARTIRYWEQVGVLPAPARMRSGYRQYTERGVERLRFIGRARALGMPLRQLKALSPLLDGEPGSGLRARLSALVGGQLAAVRRQAAELQALQQTLEHLRRRLRRPVRGDHAHGCRCLELSERSPRRNRGRPACAV